MALKDDLTQTLWPQKQTMNTAIDTLAPQQPGNLAQVMGAPPIPQLGGQTAGYKQTLNQSVPQLQPTLGKGYGPPAPMTPPAPPQQQVNTSAVNNAAPTGPAGGINVRMMDGSTQSFSDFHSADLAARQGGRILGPDGNAMETKQFRGGLLVRTPNGWVPLNVLFGGEWLPGQKEALTEGGLGAPSGGTDLQNQLANRGLNLGIGDPAGLSQDAKNMLNAQAIDSVPGRFEQQGRDLATSLRRRGGGLPQGGDYLREYAPWVAAREQTRSGLLRDVVLADEEQKQKNRELNLNAQIQGLGLASGIAGQESAADIAAKDDATRKLLAQMGIDSNERMQAAGIKSTESLAANDAALRRELAKMGIDSDKWLAQFDQETRLKLAKLQQDGGGWVTPVLASLLSTFTHSDAGKGLINDGIDWLGDLIRGGGGEDAVDAAGNVIPKVAGGGGIGTAAMSFLSSNPVTVGIAGALAVGYGVLRSQAHWEANDAVKNIENPYAQQFLIPFHDAFFTAAESGQLTREQAQASIEEYERSWQEYQRRLNEWAGNSSDRRKVADQSINNSTLRKTYDSVLKNMRMVLGAL